MEVGVRYFAAHREMVGVSQESVSVPEGTTVSDLLGILMGMHPELEPLRKDTIVSVNKGVGPGDMVLDEGDDVALFPPLQGG